MSSALEQKSQINYEKEVSKLSTTSFATALILSSQLGYSFKRSYEKSEQSGEAGQRWLTVAHSQARAQPQPRRGQGRHKARRLRWLQGENKPAWPSREQT